MKGLRSAWRDGVNWCRNKRLSVGSVHFGKMDRYRSGQPHPVSRVWTELTSCAYFLMRLRQVGRRCGTSSAEAQEPGEPPLPATGVPSLANPIPRSSFTRRVHCLCLVGSSTGIG
jgi:hypothetical protein